MLGKREFAADVAQVDAVIYRFGSKHEALFDNTCYGSIASFVFFVVRGPEITKCFVREDKAPLYPVLGVFRHFGRFALSLALASQRMKHATKLKDR